MGLIYNENNVPNTSDKRKFFSTVRKSGLEEYTNNTKYTFISREHYARQNFDTQRGNKSIERVVNFI
jgi:uncharacterized protein YaiI (UPF0178 family)